MLQVKLNNVILTNDSTKIISPHAKYIKVGNIVAASSDGGIFGSPTYVINEKYVCMHIIVEVISLTTNY